MTSTPAVVVVGCFQIILRMSIFFEQTQDLCSPAPSLSSWIFLLAFLDLLIDLNIYPMRYMHLPYFCQVIAETLIAVLLTEFGALVLWCTLERVFCRLVKSVLLVMGMSQYTYARWETLILGTVTTSISLSILIYVAQATDHLHVLRKKFSRFERKFGCTLNNFWQSKFNSGNRQRNKCHMNSDYFHSEDYDDGYDYCKKRKRRKCN